MKQLATLVALNKDNFYQEYMDIITKARKNGYAKHDTYFEKHHILPTSLGGSNNHDNIIKLTGADHFKCHYLLVKFLKDKSEEHYKMVCALNLLLRIALTSESYQEIKAENIKRLTEYSRNMVSAINIETGEVVRVTTKIFKDNPNKFVGVTKGRVPVIDKDGKSFGSILKDDIRLKNGTLNHHLKGRRYIYHPKLKKYSSVLKKDLSNYLDKGWTTDIPGKSTNLNWFYNSHTGEQTMSKLTKAEIDLWDIFGWKPGRGRQIKIYNITTKICKQIPLIKLEKYLGLDWSIGKGPSKSRKN